MDNYKRKRWDSTSRPCMYLSLNAWLFYLLLFHPTSTMDSAVRSLHIRTIPFIFIISHTIGSRPIATGRRSTRWELDSEQTHWGTYSVCLSWLVIRSEPDWEKLEKRTVYTPSHPDGHQGHGRWKWECFMAKERIRKMSSSTPVSFPRHLPLRNWTV
jgi:hypothetical protein